MLSVGANLFPDRNTKTYTIRMKITKEKVIAFFEDRCTGKEAEAIHRYLVANPRVLHDFFPEQEWLAFRSAEGLPKESSRQIWENIRRGKTPVRSLYMIRAAAAIAVIAAGFLLFKNYKSQKADLAIILPAENRDTLFINRTNRVWKDTLTDGSVVALSPAGSLRFRWNFEHDKRAVILSGEALFAVAPDTHRPFTVITPGFTTTVLGTIFRIKAYPDRSTSSIRLLKGKVVVRNTTNISQSVFLLEGQECTFEKSTNSLRRVIPSRTGFSPVIHTSLPAESFSEETGNELQFTNMPLHGVFDILSRTYHTPIQFMDKDLRGRTFTGSIEKDQPLEDALNTIAQLNDLLASRQDSSYRITTRR